jgi:hypothetical protein
VLAVLPPHVCQLELATWCEGPLLAALERFKRLRTLMLMMLISGNGARIDWGGLGAAAVVPKLQRLRLDCRDKLMPSIKFIDIAEAGATIYDSTSWLPDSMPSWLAPATDLESLGLVVAWTDAVSELCRALPSLRDLR